MSSGSSEGPREACDGHRAAFCLRVVDCWGPLPGHGVIKAQRGHDRAASLASWPQCVAVTCCFFALVLDTRFLEALVENLRVIRFGRHSPALFFSGVSVSVLVGKSARQLSALEEEFERQLEIQKQMVPLPPQNPPEPMIWTTETLPCQESALEAKSAQVAQLTAEDGGTWHRVPGLRRASMLGAAGREAEGDPETAQG